MIGNARHYTGKDLNQTSNIRHELCMSVSPSLPILWPEYLETFGHRHPLDWSKDANVFVHWVCPAPVSRYFRSLGKERIDRCETIHRDLRHHPSIPRTSSSEATRCIHPRSSSSEYSQCSDVADWHVVHTVRSSRYNRTWEHHPWDSRNNEVMHDWVRGSMKRTCLCNRRYWLSWRSSPSMDFFFFFFWSSCTLLTSYDERLRFDVVLRKRSSRSTWLARGWTSPLVVAAAAVAEPRGK